MWFAEPEAALGSGLLDAGGHAEIVRTLADVEHLVLAELDWFETATRRRRKRPVRRRSRSR